MNHTNPNHNHHHDRPLVDQYPDHPKDASVDTSQQQIRTSDQITVTCTTDVDSTDHFTEAPRLPTANRYVILPNGMFTRPQDIYVETLGGGIGRHDGGCVAMSLHDLLLRYESLDLHFARVRKENLRLKRMVSDLYQRLPTAVPPCDGNGLFLRDSSKPENKSAERLEKALLKYQKVQGNDAAITRSRNLTSSVQPGRKRERGRRIQAPDQQTLHRERLWRLLKR